MGNYTALSLETHLFFSRIMKEHAFFLEAGFPCVEADWIQRADWFRQEFENLLRDVVQISSGRIGKEILYSDELVTEFTIPAERSTQQLSGVAIDSSISAEQKNLRPKCSGNESRELLRIIDRINRRALELLDGLIDFKENILKEVSRGKLFNANYPLLIEHILREAKLYRVTVRELLRNEQLTYKNLRATEQFWNQIMMEHALFIRGLLDPTEEELIESANQFAMNYKELLERAKQQDFRASNLTRQALEETYKYRDFKAAGAEGILDCKIASIILPLLADHVLREANHYIRLLETEDNR